MSSHILLTYVTKAAPFAGRLVMPGDPEDEAGDYDPERPIARGKVRVFDQPGRSAQWRKKKDFAKVAFIRTRPAAWVLRKSVIAPLLSGVPAGEIALVPTELCDDKGVVDDDWVHHALQFRSDAAVVPRHEDEAPGDLSTWPRGLDSEGDRCTASDALSEREARRGDGAPCLFAAGTEGKAASTLPWMGGLLLRGARPTLLRTTRGIVRHDDRRRWR